MPTPEPLEAGRGLACAQASSDGLNEQKPRHPLGDVEHHVVEELRREMHRVVADVEFRLRQEYELRARREGMAMERVYAEDIHDMKHRLTGFTLTSNSPTPGVSIAWSNLHVVYNGVDYTIAAGNSGANKYVWFVKPGTYTPGVSPDVVLVSGNTPPVLSPDDALLFINTNGVATTVDQGVSYAVANGVIGDAQVSGGIAQSKVAGLGTALQAGLDAAAAAQATADGAITQYVGANFPWPNGSTDPSAVLGLNPARTAASFTGDVQTFQGASDQVAYPDGVSYRWTGPSTKTWVLITDTGVSKALADSAKALGLASGKTTAYYRTVAQGAPPTPTDGFVTGDEWIQTDNGNYTQRWTGSAWSPVVYGDAAIGSGLSGAKIGPGITPANLTGAGTAPLGAIPQLDAKKLNLTSHFLL